MTNNNSKIYSENGKINILARDTVSLVGANVDGASVSVKAKHLITESVQDSIYSNSNGLDLSAGLSFSNKDGSKKIFTDKAVSAGSAGFGIRDGYEDKVWTNSATTLTSRGKLMIDVEDEVKNKGAIIGSKTGEMDLKAKRLILEDLEDKDYAREFGLNISKSEGKREEKNIFGNDNETTWKETINLQNNSSKKDGITYSTIGEGNINIGEKMYNNKVITDDLENLNRDLNLNQKITRDKIMSALDGELVVDDEMVYLLEKGLEGLGFGATYWHFELREKLNKEETLTSTREEMKNIADGDPSWSNFSVPVPLTGLYADEYHQYKFKDENDKEYSNYLEDYPENRNIKYVNSDGREAVYDGYYNKGQLITTELINNTIDPDQKANYINAKGTYNYVSVIKPKRTDNIFKWMGKALLTPVTFLGHELLDDLPYQLGGNIRGKDPKKVPIKVERIKNKKTGNI